MSGGTSAGNIVTEAPAVYAARTWIAVEKIDALGVISDAQLATINGANWYNNVDDNLAQVNAWLNGTSEAAHIRADEATLTTLNATTVTMASVEATSAMIGAGALTDGVSSADDLVVGALEATDHGLTILSTAVGRVCFADTAATLTGFMAYTHASDTLTLGVAGAAELDLTATTLAPRVSDGLALGSSVLHYSAAHVGAVTAYASVTIGDATGSPTLTINRDATGNGDIIFAAEGATGWRLRHAAAGGLSLDRFKDGGVLDSITIGASDGLVTLPGSLSVTNSVTISGDLFANGSVEIASALMLYADNATLSVGSGNGTADVALNGASTSITFQDGGQTQFNILCDGSLSFGRYDGGVYKDAVYIDGDTGGVFVPASLTVGSTSTSFAHIALSKHQDGDASHGYYNNGVMRWAWQFDSGEDLTLRRFNSTGTFQDIVTISNANGSWTFPAGIGVSGTGKRFTAGLAAPTGGADGDLYWRTGGTRATCLYYKTAGTWEPLLT